MGATRKLGEAFLKLYINKKEITTILQRLNNYLGSVDIESVHYHFIVPEGSRFIKGLGYRGRIFIDDFVKLTSVPLAEEDLAPYDTIFAHRSGSVRCFRKRFVPQDPKVCLVNVPETRHFGSEPRELIAIGVKLIRTLL